MTIDSPDVPFDPALGRDIEAQFQPARIELRAGEKLVIYTGGMINAFDRNGRQFSMQRLEETLCEAAGKPVADLVDETLAVIERFMEGSDCKVDLTCLAFMRGA